MSYYYLEATAGCLELGALGVLGFEGGLGMLETAEVGVLLGIGGELGLFVAVLLKVGGMLAIILLMLLIVGSRSI